MKNLYFTLLLTIISLFTYGQNQPFITTWEVTASDLDITIPTHTGSTYNYTVDFGDGTTLTNQTGNASHTYSTAGIYTVKITGIFPRIYSYSSNYLNRKKIKSVEQWGDIQWQNMAYAFRGCQNLVINAIDAPDLTQVTDLSGMFDGCSNFNQSINHWDVSNITDMTAMFIGTIAFNQPLNNWNVSNVTDMTAMFAEAYAFNQNINTWDVSNVTNMNSMFNYAISFNQPLNNWDVSNVTGMASMFLSAESFNQPLNNWDVSNVIEMGMDFPSPALAEGGMFGWAKAFDQPLDNWDVSNVTDMSFMFNDAISFNKPLNNWDVSNVTDMKGMFNNAESFNKPLNNWDVSNVTDFSYMFAEADAFDQNINNWNVSNVTDMTAMFALATSFNQPLNNWDVSNVTIMGGEHYFTSTFGGYGIFDGATSFNQPLNNWDVSNVTDFGYMFYNATAFNQPLDQWDVNNATAMEGMFANATSFNQDLSTWVFHNSVLLNHPNVTIPYGFVENSGLDIQNYENLLTQFSTLGLSNKTLSATGLEYCDETARDNLLNNLGWTITNDSKSLQCFAPFITTWEVTPSDLGITIPTFTASTYNYTVDFGDGTTLTNQTGDASHTTAPQAHILLKYILISRGSIFIILQKVLKSNRWNNGVIFNGNQWRLPLQGVLI